MIVLCVALNIILKKNDATAFYAHYIHSRENVSEQTRFIHDVISDIVSLPNSRK